MNATAQGQGDATYRYLRVVVPIAALWLLISIATVSWVRHQVLGSISDYYGGPLRDVFVGTLVASGICLVAYKGESKLEDYTLNFAGVNAVFVALVPNSFQALLDATRSAENQSTTAGDAPSLLTTSSADLLKNLKLVTSIFLIIVVLFVLVDVGIMKWTKFRLADQPPLANALICITFVAQFVLFILIVTMLFGVESVLGKSVFSTVHFTAAALLVVNLSFASASHAVPDRLCNQNDSPAESGNSRLFFKIITAVMWICLVAVGASIYKKVDHAIFTTEVVEVGLFIVFWVGATQRDWRPPARR